MIYRDFDDIKLSGLGLGMMRLPVINGDDGVIDEPLAEKMVALAMKNGINYYDTAWGYHNGNSELVAGKILSKYPRDSYYLASKFPGYDNSNIPKVKEIFEEQLKKCQTPYFDFYLFHNVYEGNIDDYLNEDFGTLNYLLEQKKNGRIKHLGFSCHGGIDVLKRWLDLYGEHMEFCQLQLNFMDWDFQNAKQKVELCRERNIPVWVMEPLRGGRLCNLPDEMTEKMKSLRPDESTVGWAFRFLQAIPDVKVVLSGMSNMEQLEENISIWQSDKPLNDNEFATLTSMMNDEVKRGGIPCTACHYCTSHCPQELEIPELIVLYNEHMSTVKAGVMSFIAPMAIGSMAEDKRPSSCVGCKSCEQVCPQQIEISKIMSDFTKML